MNQVEKFWHFHVKIFHISYAAKELRVNDGEGQCLGFLSSSLYLSRYDIDLRERLWY